MSADSAFWLAWPRWRQSLDVLSQPDTYNDTYTNITQYSITAYYRWAFTITVLTCSLRLCHA
jgi:hypothetical protein